MELVGWLISQYTYWREFETYGLVPSLNLILISTTNKLSDVRSPCIITRSYRNWNLLATQSPLT